MWTHLKEITNTDLLISVSHSYLKSANMEVFDLSRKEQVNKIYSYEEVQGGLFWINLLFPIQTQIFFPPQNPQKKRIFL